MKTITIIGSLTAADVKARTITGLVLPFGQPGRTSAGLVTASKDSVKIADAVLFNMEHDNTRPIGKMLSHQVTDAGIEMTFSVAKTTAGNDLLAEIEDGLRTGLSVEVQEPVIRGGNLLGGLLDAVASVVRPAFDAARVNAVTASDVGEVDETDDETDEDDEDQVDDESTDDTETTADEAEDDTEDDESEDNQEDDTVKTATASLAASAASGKADTKGIKTTAEFLDRLVAARNSGDRALIAALADITQTGVGGDIASQQFLGELWSGRGYVRSIVPLMQSGTLTSYSVKGWRWTKGQKPQVAAYSGDKAAVASNTVDTEAVTIAAARLAGAHSFDRKFADFGDTEFLASYLGAMTESYARQTDSIALSFLQTNATSVTPGSVPTGISNAAGAIVDGALAVLPMGVPDFAIVSTGAYRSLLLTPRDKVLELLSMALGLEEGNLAGFRVVPSAGLLPGQVVVGCQPASQFLELPGVPIRVDAQNLANGGIDEALFGYYATMLHNADGLAKVTLAATSIDAGPDFAMTVGATDGSAGPTVWATYSDGSKINITSDPACVLTSGTPAKATIVNNKVHAVAAGTSVITATYQGLTDTATVTVS